MTAYRLLTGAHALDIGAFEVQVQLLVHRAGKPLIATGKSYLGMTALSNLTMPDYLRRLKARQRRQIKT